MATPRPPAARASPFLRYGLPFVLFCAGGYGALALFMRGVVEKRDARVVRRSARAAQLADAHADIVGKLALGAGDLKLKPIHRPTE